MKKFIFIMLMFLIANNSFSENRQKVIFVFKERVPVAYNEKNQFKGLYVDILREIFENRLNMKIIFRPRPWKRAQMEILNGNADIIITVPTKKRLEYTLKTDYPILTFFIRVYTYKNHSKLKEINKIKSTFDIKKLGLVPVSYIGNGWHRMNIDKKGIKTHYVSNMSNALMFLVNKRADIMIASEIFVNYLIKINHLCDSIEITKAKFGPINMYILISKKSKLVKLLPKINNILKNLNETGYINKITKKYLAVE